MSEPRTLTEIISVNLNAPFPLADCGYTTKWNELIGTPLVSKQNLVYHEGLHRLRNMTFEEYIRSRQSFGSSKLLAPDHVANQNAKRIDNAKRRSEQGLIWYTNRASWVLSGLDDGQLMSFFDSL